MSTTPGYRTVETAIEGLYEDERLRSNLEDHEAEVVLKWAEDWLTERAAQAHDEASAKQIVEAESRRVRAVLGALNDLKPDSGLPEAVAAIEPLLAGGKPFTREELLTLLTVLVSAAWKLRSQ